MYDPRSPFGDFEGADGVLSDLDVLSDTTSVPSNGEVVGVHGSPIFLPGDFASDAVGQIGQRFARCR